jgi:hypothetical protein
MPTFHDEPILPTQVECGPGSLKPVLSCSHEDPIEAAMTCRPERGKGPGNSTEHHKEWELSAGQPAETTN